GAALRVWNGQEFTAAGDFANQGWAVIGAGGRLTVSGVYTQTDGTTTLENGTLVAALVDLKGGYLNGYGTVQGNVQNAALVHVGTVDATGLLTIDGNYTQTAAGTLALRIGGPLVGAEFDQLQVTGTAKLDGALGVSLLGGYVPPPGDPFLVLV